MQWLALGVAVACASVLLIRPSGRMRIPLIILFPLAILFLTRGIVPATAGILFALGSLLPLLFVIRGGTNEIGKKPVPIRALVTPVLAATGFALFATLYLRSVTVWRALLPATAGSALGINSDPTVSAAVTLTLLPVVLLVTILALDRRARIRAGRKS